MRTRLQRVIFLVLCSLLMYGILIYYWVSLAPVPDPSQLISDRVRQQDDKDKEYYVVNTDTCKIVNHGVWGPHIVPHFHPVPGDNPKWPFDCEARSPRHWTYVENSNIVINETALRERGFSMDTIHCCYKAMQRIYNATAEMSHVHFSEECHPMNSTHTTAKFEFVRVVCAGRGFPLPDGAILYKQFHAIALPSVIPKRKIERWSGAGSKMGDQPPDIVVIGIDSMSRLNVQRAMPSTWRKLQEMDAVEMFGYTKVGESTYANLAVLLSGYPSTELLRKCHSGGEYANAYDTEDDCPYIWKEFNAANYTTALMEDRIGMALANLNGEGFIEKPVDFYFRPFMQGVYDHQPYYQMKFMAKPNAMDCVGHKTVDEAFLDYVRNLLNSTAGPKFIFFWNSNLAHEDMTAPLNVDHLYQKFLADLYNLSAGKNTVLLFLSDHGARYGAYRKTLAGWQEEKLPALWIWLSPELRAKKPDWIANLQANSRKLTSAFDTHQMLIHILRESGKVQASSLAQRPRAGVSFFDSVISDTRTCSDAGIATSFCVCSTPKEISITSSSNREILELVAQAVLRALNDELRQRSTCSMLRLREITAAATIEGSFYQADQANLDDDARTELSSTTNYLITFYADPGEILIEANVVYDKSRKQLSVDKTEPIRVNRMTRSTSSCIQDNRLEKFCYCE